MTAPSGRIDAYLVCGGVWHDFDFARLELLKLLAEDERVRVKVAEHYEDLDDAHGGRLPRDLHLRRPPERGRAAGAAVVGRGRRPVVRAPRHEQRHRPAGRQGRGPVHHAAGLPGVRRHPRQPVPLPSDDRALPGDDHARRRGRPPRRGHRGLRRQRRAVPVRVPRRARAAPADPLDGHDARLRRGFVAGRRPSAGHVPPAPGPGVRALPDPGPLPRPLRHGRRRRTTAATGPTCSEARGRSPSSTSCCGGACRGPRRRPGPPSRPGAPAARRSSDRGARIAGGR